MLTFQQDIFGKTRIIMTHQRVVQRMIRIAGLHQLFSRRQIATGTPCPPDLLRLSVGVEDSGDLFDDLDQALRRADNA